MTSLSGIRILDLSRVLAGPWCTQTLADLGADVIKIERPGTGDDTRGWGPPFLKDAAGHDTAEAAYYLGTNRNKRSVTCDIAQPAGKSRECREDFRRVGRQRVQAAAFDHVQEFLGQDHAFVRRIGRRVLRIRQIRRARDWRSCRSRARLLG